MPQTVFVVEDNTDIAELVKRHLQAAGYGVRVFARSEHVVREAKSETPALFLLDIMLPGGDGMELCRQIRRSEELGKVPVIFLTAKSSEADKVAGLEMGADDFVSKPFSPRELVARIKAVLRRFEPTLTPEKLRFGALEIDTQAMILRLNGERVSTTATEFRLLAHMAKHKGKVFTRDQLLNAVWKETSFVTPRSVDVYMRRLREKIEANPEDPRFLITVRGAGYRFEGGQ